MEQKIAAIFIVTFVSLIGTYLMVSWWKLRK